MLDAKVVSCRYGCNEITNSVAVCHYKLCKDNAREELCNVFSHENGL